ncbi:MAG: caspase family protein, partial [Thiomargarita sp.]|nr:caspase family protein [Thiomargarita sp.]
MLIYILLGIFLLSSCGDTKNPPTLNHTHTIAHTIVLPVEPLPIESPVITVTKYSIKEISIDKRITHTIRGIVSVAKDTTLRKVVINGDEVMTSRENDRYSFSHEVTLTLGNNLFYLTAKDNKNTKSETIEINIPVIRKDNIPPEIILAKHTSNCVFRGVKTRLVHDTDYLVATMHTFISDTETYTLQGSVSDESALKSVTINGIPVQFTPIKDKYWRFSHHIKLTIGNNPISITATDSYDNVVSKNISVQLPVSLQAGQYYALVIGINEYPHHKHLKTAVNDANEVSKILKGLYGFQTTLLLNNAATREGILNEFDLLSEKLKEHDHLLVYYAGHGDYAAADKAKQKPYWLPYDAASKRTANWISARTIKDHLKRNPANNILVVADSCYTGALTRSASNLDEYSENDSRFKYLN